MLKSGNGSNETEVQKPKYGSEKNSRLSVFSALLARECVVTAKATQMVSWSIYAPGFS